MIPGAAVLSGARTGQTEWEAVPRPLMQGLWGVAAVLAFLLTIQQIPHALTKSMVALSRDHGT